MPGYRRWLAAGMAAFVVGLVTVFPARVAWQWFAPPGVALSGIDGSVWHGSAREASAHGLYLRNLGWRMNPGALFTGRVAYRLEGTPGGGSFDANVSLAPDGDARITDLAGTVPLALLETLVGVPGIGGYAEATFATIEVADGVPVRADGLVEVRNLVLPLIAPDPLGAYRAEFQTRDGSIVAAVRDDGGVVDLAGQLTVSPGRDYEFLGYVAPTADSPPRLVQQLQYLGSPNARGQYELRLSGRY